MTAIETKHLTKRFNEEVVAVDRLDLRVTEGEVFGFLGPNGAGKSTVINVLLDFVRPTEGDVTVLGYDPTTDAEQIRRRTGVLPEGASLYARLTGREHIGWVARANDATVDVDSLLSRVGLSSDEAGRAVGDYSKGMRRRLALAMALVGDPELLILDEPSAGLDPTGMQEFREIIRAEAGDGRTVFFSSHILGEVEAVCDRIGILNDGCLVATGTPDALRSNLDLGGTISIDVAYVPDALALNAIDGVEDVTIDESTITATITDSTKKIEVISELDEHTRILDITSAETSLERLFNTYTSSSREDAPAVDNEIGAAEVGVKR
ncbi:ATP-binding cassette domain-containing protein [Natronorubrum sp. JWXQ-INN-674]|uniref:ATP-binding cassette domain-containing protein n=1 Tax=Natronorubrum halalkaliphilum TaxID=2691917 RepID=A0A6B0VKG0_9EURY|nr:ABC transporter ATP-binding protein [Natronorubrum halalkaliphilum]MXV61272.1 ATP-binding cassette domain-containing protein [Natronorubrum halalkaliphilum]